MKFEFNWPSSFRGDVWKCWQTDAGVTGILIAHPWAEEGSGELKSQYSVCISQNLSQKIAIRGDGKSPDQKVIDMQLQAANLVYIFDVIILSVTANKSGRLTVETSFLPLNSQASSYKVHSREITYKSSKGEQQFLNARHPLDLLYIYTIYYQNISKDIKVIERTSFPL